MVTDSDATIVSDSAPLSTSGSGLLQGVAYSREWPTAASGLQQRVAYGKE